VATISLFFKCSVDFTMKHKGFSVNWAFTTNGIHVHSYSGFLVWVLVVCNWICLSYLSHHLYWQTCLSLAHISGGASLLSEAAQCITQQETGESVCTRACLLPSSSPSGHRPQGPPFDLI
jgi:hypothetical protein